MNQAIQEFNLLSSPLQGVNLIEASAGTGKTFTITGLFLRLLVEKELTVDQILVVTFTEAATNELRERIRNKLQAAKAALISRASKDKLLSNLVNKNQCDTSIKKISDAIRDFDEAAIYTIHSFCNKILTEHAFESKGLFDTELITEQNDILQEVVEDFWRQKMYNDSGLFVRYACDKINPNSLLDLVMDKIGLPFLEIIPDVIPIETGELEELYRNSFLEVQKRWPTNADSIKQIFYDNKGLNRSRYKVNNIPMWIKALEAYLSFKDADPVLPKGFEKFTTSTLSKGMKKGFTPPVLPFFETCEAHFQNHKKLEAAYNQRLIAFETELFSFVRAELKKRKLERNIFFFDDLLLNLHDALRHNEYDVTSTVRERYKAALIDEFQDTDPVQYEIFKSIFGNEHSILFLIGDPKQAIYGFRGADIFAFLRAKDEVRQHYTLSNNYRSTPALVNAINNIFAKPMNPFIYENIPYHICNTTEEGYTKELILGENPLAPVQLWFVDAYKFNESGRAITKPEAREILPKSIACEIVNLLTLSRQGKATLGDEPLAEKDIAVLVRTNQEARLVQDALRKVNVHSVLYSSANLFESHEAMEVERILSALVEPKRTHLVKAALTTDIIGIRGESLLSWEEDETNLEEWFEKFSYYHNLWRDYGFIRMFKELIVREELQVRLIAFADGERRITNLLHLAEVLNQNASDLNLGMAGLVKWLAEQRAQKTAPAEEHQLRLESDENAVKLVTMHMCKGLEYPVVFCPFTWSGSFVRSGDSIKFHDENNNWILTIDLGSNQIEINKISALQEELAENLRLLYVAVTRAKNLCYLTWGNFTDGRTSAPGYLFHQPDNLGTNNIVAVLKDSLKSYDDALYRNELNTIISDANETIALVDLPDYEVEPLAKYDRERSSLSYRKFRTKIEKSERIASYSSMVSRTPHIAELPDYDTLIPSPSFEPIEEKDKITTFTDFPRGAKTGTFIHDVFQNLDFTTGQTAIEELVQKKLNDYGFKMEWSHAVCCTIDNLLKLKLVNDSSFTLSQLHDKNRLNELEFYFPLNQITPSQLQDIFSKITDLPFNQEWLEKLKELNFSPLKGFMKGFIDLVFSANGKFYIIDWKSNFLGNSIENYDQRSMTEAMISNLYILQYHIYTIALNQYLKLRLPNYDYKKHFGGVFYIFLRGIDLEFGEDYGLFKDKPSLRLINELTERLIGTDSIA